MNHLTAWCIGISVPLGVILIIWLIKKIGKWCDKRQDNKRAHESDHEFITELKKEHKELMEAVGKLIVSQTGQIRSSLVKAHSDYMIRGSITLDESEVWLQDADNYTGLGGNGRIIPRIRADIKHLSTLIEKEK